MQLIIETDEEYAPMFRAVAKAVKAKVRTGESRASRKSQSNEEKGPFIEEGTAQPGEKPSDFAGAWKNNPRTLKEIRDTAWKKRD